MKVGDIVIVKAPYGPHIGKRARIIKEAASIWGHGGSGKWFEVELVDESSQPMLSPESWLEKGRDENAFKVDLKLGSHEVDGVRVVDFPDEF